MFVLNIVFVKIKKTAKIKDKSFAYFELKNFEIVYDVPAKVSFPIFC